MTGTLCCSLVYFCALSDGPAQILGVYFLVFLFHSCGRLVFGFFEDDQLGAWSFPAIFCVMSDADSRDFMLEVLSFMSLLGEVGLENSGLRFPAVDWDWVDCCHACVWLGFMGYELPSNLMSRLVLVPGDRVVLLYLEWLRHKSRSVSAVDMFDLAG